MAKRKPPEPNPTHWTLKPAGSKDYKGTYFRRLDDIRKGLLEIDKSKMPAGGRFLFLYYGCEKLGKGIVGIHKTRAADEAYDQHLHLSELGRMGLAIPDAELDALFVGDDKQQPVIGGTKSRGAARNVANCCMMRRRFSSKSPRA